MQGTTKSKTLIIFYFLYKIDSESKIISKKENQNTFITPSSHPKNKQIKSLYRCASNNMYVA